MELPKPDDSTYLATASHVYKGDYLGNKGRDLCLEMFGEEDEDCKAYNENL